MNEGQNSRRIFAWMNMHLNVYTHTRTLWSSWLTVCYLHPILMIEKFEDIAVVLRTLIINSCCLSSWRLILVYSSRHFFRCSRHSLTVFWICLIERSRIFSEINSCWEARSCNSFNVEQNAIVNEYLWREQKDRGWELKGYLFHSTNLL